MGLLTGYGIKDIFNVYKQLCNKKAADAYAENRKLKDDLKSFKKLIHDINVSSFKLNKEFKDATENIEYVEEHNLHYVDNYDMIKNMLRGYYTKVYNLEFAMKENIRIANRCFNKQLTRFEFSTILRLYNKTSMGAVFLGWKEFRLAKGMSPFKIKLVDITQGLYHNLGYGINWEKSYANKAKLEKSGIKVSRWAVNPAKVKYKENGIDWIIRLDTKVAPILDWHRSKRTTFNEKYFRFKPQRSLKPVVDENGNKVTLEEIANRLSIVDVVKLDMSIKDTIRTIAYYKSDEFYRYQDDYKFDKSELTQALKGRLWQ